MCSNTTEASVGRHQGCVASACGRAEPAHTSAPAPSPHGSEAQTPFGLFIFPPKISFPLFLCCPPPRTQTPCTTTLRAPARPRRPAPPASPGPRTPGGAGSRSRSRPAPTSQPPQVRHGHQPYLPAPQHVAVRPSLCQMREARQRSDPRTPPRPGASPAAASA